VDVLSVVNRYILYQDVADTTEAYYRRVASVYSEWCKLKLVMDFTPESVSQFLLDKQRAGLSSHYRKSLRNGLRALLNSSGQKGPVRSVRLEPLAIEVWSAGDVAKLIGSVESAVILDRKTYWKTIITAGWCTGLSQGDLFRVNASNIDPGGRIIIRRSRTRKLCICAMPPDLLDYVRSSKSPPWALQTSPEYFRREFAAIVTAAGLKGTFKKLRKSSGTDVEINNPGRGHIHLANSRQVFERHYLPDSAVPIQPAMPTPLAY
jgi:hypothetical protein